MDSRVSPLPEAALPLLACPFCGAGLEALAHAYRCAGCGESYPVNGRGQADLRLRRPKDVLLPIRLGQDPDPRPGRVEVPFPENPEPAVNLAAAPVPRHFTRELLSHLPDPRQGRGLLLDLGCGRVEHARTLSRLGFTYVGLDYASRQAPILGDGHALPFREASFDAILCHSVLEHLRHPALMVREARRALVPGGAFLGSVAFLEPQHGGSLYHMTHLGLLALLDDAGFEVRAAGPSADYTAPRSLARLGLFPWLPKPLSRLPVSPLVGLHKLWWRVNRGRTPHATERNRVLLTAGDFNFVAVRPE